MNVFFAGHNNFGNRGCEALVRSITSLLSRERPGSTFAVPSVRPDLDAAQWPEHASAGVQFIQAQGFPQKLRVWQWSRRAVPAVEYLGRPSHQLTAGPLDAMNQSDVVVMTGGDTISLDYDLQSLYDHAGYIDNARRLGKKTVLWAASVGPFSRKPHVERLMKRHLADYDQITVRESSTMRYLREIGVEGVTQVVDPAFVLQPQPFDADVLLPVGANGTIGLNVSPLIRKFRASAGSREQLDQEVSAFIRDLHDVFGYGLLLLPHVGPLDGGVNNSDHAYMAGLIERYRLSSPHVALAPATLNAAQLKFLISRLRFFIGARTHATIAAFSTGVPTLSIAYSVKAKGINADLFDDLPVVLETPDVSQETLVRGLRVLEEHEQQIRNLLAERVPRWRERAAEPAKLLMRLVPAKQGG